MKQMRGNADLIHLNPLRQQVDYAGVLDLLTILAEVTLGFKTPVQGTNDPILQSLDVKPDLLVDPLISKVGDTLDVGDEGVNSILAKFSNHVNRLLEVHPMMLHENRDEVMGVVTSGLFNIVGEDVLKRGVSTRSG